MKKPKLKMPVIHTLGWWSHQDILKLESFNVEVIKGNLNLFNSQAIVAYTISGMPHVEEIFISERFNTDKNLDFDRIVEIIPIVKVRQLKKYPGIEKFNFTNEHIINSTHWGPNKIKFICGEFEQIVVLNQSK